MIMIDIDNFVESIEFERNELTEELERLETKYEELFFTFENPQSDFPANVVDEIKKLRNQVEISYLNEAQELYENFKDKISKLNIGEYYE